MTTDGLDYLAAISADAAALVDAAETAGLDARVPSCPDWAVADLLEHIGTVHRWAAGNCERPPDAPYVGSSELGIEPPPPEARPEWVREGAARLVEVLGAHSPDTPAWTWAPPATIGFWRRRQAHETAMHRVDAQLAADAPQPIDAALAADGIDEWLSVIPNRPWARDAVTGSGETIHFHCTDVEGEWLVRLGSDGITVERAHAKGNVAARGSASDLLCWLQGRGPRDRLEIFGGVALLDRWRELARF